MPMLSRSLASDSARSPINFVQTGSPRGPGERRKGELTMRVGLFYFPTDYGIDIRELARAAEERGFESLFFPEHTHIPKSRRTPFPGGGALPRAYSHTDDPFVA